MEAEAASKPEESAGSEHNQIKILLLYYFITLTTSKIPKVYTNPIPFPSSQSNTAKIETETLSLSETIPGSTIKCSSNKPRIERINTPPEQLEKLNKDLAGSRLSPSAKQNMIRRITGFCSNCGGLPEFFMIYDCSGVQKLERYCQKCLDNELDRQKSNYYSIEY